jgi:hypothetical protein
MSIVRERRKYFKSEARFLLKYNYPKQIFMTGIVVLLTFGLNAIKTNLIKLLELEYSFFSMPVNMFIDLLTLFITLPLYIGIIYVNMKLFEGENISVGGMFYYFSSSANLIDCYKFITAIAARFIAFAVPFLFIGALFPQIAELFEYIFPIGSIIEIDIAMLCACVVYLIAFFICVILFMKYFAGVFIFVKNPCLNVKDIIKKSSKMMKKRKIEALKLILSFSVWIIISHYFAGILYIFFTIPYILLSYTSFLSFVLSEKGGNEFLTGAGDYITEKHEKRKKLRAKKVKIESCLRRKSKV